MFRTLIFNVGDVLIPGYYSVVRIRPRHWFWKYIIILYYCVHYKLISVAGNGTRAGRQITNIINLYSPVHKQKSRM